MAQSFHILPVTDIIRETADSVSLVFQLTSDLQDAFAFKSGQYVTLKRDIGGEEIRRSYSICTAPLEGILKVNVKKVDKGRMSTYIVDKLQKGESLEVGTPEGSFTMTFEPSKRRNHYFIAAGSGITPVISLIKDGLENEPLSNFILLFGNRNEDNVIFQQELDQLGTHFGDQLTVIHAYSQLKSGGSLFGLFSKKKSEDGPWAGRIDNKKLSRLIEEIPTQKSENHFYLCGPGELITMSQKWLKEQKIIGLEIHKEYFANPDQDTGGVLSTQDAVLKYTNLHGSDGELSIPAGKTILDTLMDAGMDPPYSCMNGVCSSCVAKLTKGQVEMETCLALEDEEIEAGYILTCQSQCLTPEIEIEYDA